MRKAWVRKRRAATVLCASPRYFAIAQRQRGHRVVPERLSGDWWEDHYTREYYRVSTERGDLLWVYYDPRPRAWFWHGWWD